MVSNRALSIAACVLLAMLLIRNEARMDRMEAKLDDIIQTRDTVKYTSQDRECLTKNIYYEAGVEGVKGKYAVAHVTVNRLKTGRWGNTVCKVVYAKKQFSWTAQEKLPKPNAKLWSESQAVAVNVLNGARIRGLQKSLYYHADYIRTPHWADRGEFATQIGQHKFYNKARTV